MSDWGLYIALIAAVAIGFWQGRRYQHGKDHSTSHYLDQRYFQGLNFLLNEQPDAAIDAFIKALEVNSETLETHLALGKLLRKRGEVDRAIRIHQNLLARPGLSLEQSQQAQYELATDFAKAGLLDRAEGLLKELVKVEGPFQIDGLKQLLEVYRDEKEWQSGLEVLQLLSGSRLSKSYDQWLFIRAHFCCELAEEAIAVKDFNAARQWLKQGLQYDKSSVRAIIASGQLEIMLGNYQRGIQYLKKIVEQGPDYLAEVIPYLAEGYHKLSQFKKYRRFLQEIYRHQSSPVLALALTDAIAQEDGGMAAAEFIAKEVRDNPSGMGLLKLLDYYLSFADAKSREHLMALKVVVERIIRRSSYYQCNHCGFKGQKLHWLCPSCKQWGQVKPLKYVGDI